MSKCERCERVTPENWAELQREIARQAAALTPEEIAAGEAWARQEIARLRRDGIALLNAPMEA